MARNNNESSELRRLTIAGYAILGASAVLLVVFLLQGRHFFSFVEGLPAKLVAIFIAEVLLLHAGWSVTRFFITQRPTIMYRNAIALVSTLFFGSVIGPSVLLGMKKFRLSLNDDHPKAMGWWANIDMEFFETTTIGSAVVYLIGLVVLLKLYESARNSERV